MGTCHLASEFPFSALDIINSRRNQGPGFLPILKTNPSLKPMILRRSGHGNDSCAASSSHMEQWPVTTKGQQGCLGVFKVALS